MLRILLGVIICLIGGSLAENANMVWGQFGSFDSATPSNGGVSPNSLNNPVGMVVDSSGGVYISDTACNRVLYYVKGSTTASIVWGQQGSFVTNQQNNGGLSANSLLFPQRIALDVNEDLLVADALNNRVLFFPKGTTTATRSYGQNNLFNSAVANLGGISATSLNRPLSVRADASNDIYIVDTSNNRVLFYVGTSTTASRVYGQPNFATSNGNAGISASSLSSPSDVAIDNFGNVYICDNNDNRILVYGGASTVASRVIGQTSFTTGTEGLSASSLSLPTGIAVDSLRNVYVCDRINNRILKFAANALTAELVIGQESFTTNTPNNGGLSSSSVEFPEDVAVDVNNTLYVLDSGNSRALCYGCGSGVTTTGSATTKPAFAYNLVPQVPLLVIFLMFIF